MLPRVSIIDMPCWSTGETSTSRYALTDYMRRTLVIVWFGWGVAVPLGRVVPR